MARKRTRRRRRAFGCGTMLGEPTKKDFEAMANILCRHNAPADFTNDIARYFGGQNPRFNEDRFVAAARTICRR